MSRTITSTNVEEKTSSELLKQLDIDFTDETAHRHIEHFCSLMGDRSDRLSDSQWLSATMPLPDRTWVVHALIDERNPACQQARIAKSIDGCLLAPHFERRAQVVGRLRDRLVAGLDYEKLLSTHQKPSGPVSSELFACFTIAMNRLLIDAQDPTAQMMDPDRRKADPELARRYQHVLTVAIDVAERATVQILWFNRLAESCAKRLPHGSEGIHQDLEVAMARRLPEAWRAVSEMAKACRASWEQQRAPLYRRRLAERIIEEEAFDQPGL